MGAMTVPGSPVQFARSERSLARIAVLWLLVVAAIVAVGSAGYVLLSGWSVDDAVYMTVITLATVGFREVRELDTIGRIWTMLLSLTGVGIIFGTVGILAESVIAEALSGRRERRRMVDRVRALQQHFILCGYGRVGRTTASELQHAGVRFVVIDINQASVEAAARDGFLVVAGDATHDDVLQAAGVDRARGLITTMDSDANNVYVTLSARALNPGLFIVARANDESSESKLRQAGADRVVSPYSRAGRQIASMATRPRVADFIDYALSHGQLAFSIEEIEVTASDSVAGQTVGNLVTRGIHPLAIAHGPREFDTNPPADRVLVAGDQLIVSGTAEALRALRPTP
jgi:voltage-gated potassium channel